MQIEVVTRQQAESVTQEAMSVMGAEITRHVTDVYDNGFAAGKSQAFKDIGYTLATLKANLNNRNLSDADFREFVGTIAERLSEQCAG